MPKPTIAELEAILASDGPLEIELLPDGSVHAVPYGTRNDAKVEPLTLESALATAEANISRINAVPDGPPTDTDEPNGAECKG